MAALAGKVALITGGANGQGAAFAEAFVREGAAVVITDIDPGGAALAARLGNQGRALFRSRTSPTSAAGPTSCATTLAAFGALHILVNNAGTIARQGIVDTSLAAWNRTLAVNLTAPLLGMKYCAPAIRDSVARQGRRRLDHQHVVDRRHHRL